MQLRVIDNDHDEIIVTFGGKEIRGWSYADEVERRVKMLAAREFSEGWFQASHESLQTIERLTVQWKTQRQDAIEEVLDLLTAHELYRYRPKAFHGFIDHCRTELIESRQPKRGAV